MGAVERALRAGFSGAKRWRSGGVAMVVMNRGRVREIIAAGCGEGWMRPGLGLDGMLELAAPTYQ